MFLQVNQRAAEEGTDDSEKEEDGGFSNIVSSLKKQKEQRKEQKDYDKKRRGGNSDGGDDERFVLQAAAANRQIAVAESKNMIEFLQMAQGASVWDEGEMKEIFRTARDSIFGCSKEKQTERTTETSSSDDHLDSDGEDIYN